MHDDLPGVCDGHGNCRDVLENPCSDHGCKEKRCGASCLVGDIKGWCDHGRNCISVGEKPDCSMYLSHASSNIYDINIILKD